LEGRWVFQLRAIEAHAPLNVALTIWALLYGDSDFEKSILYAVNAGFDTDCTTATVGATLGLLLGSKGIPEKWSQPIGTGVYIGMGILDIQAPKTLEELTERVLQLHGRLPAARWSSAVWEPTAESLLLTQLPCTIYLQPLNSDQQIPWANGELPREVKRAGGATWTWECATQESRRILCLARNGARLYLDGQQIHDYPTGLPYVPATHRSGEASVYWVDNPQGHHELRLELLSKDENQEAAVILTYPNRHIAPWTATDLPDAAKYPPRPERC
jgi:hypothetical protein